MTMSAEQLATRDEVAAWFFHDYLPRWVAVGAGKSEDTPEFILQYWSVPMHVCAAELNTWLLDADAVLAFLEMNHGPLREGDYSHTNVPDKSIRVYHAAGAAIEVIWSRCRADDSASPWAKLIIRRMPYTSV